MRSSLGERQTRLKDEKRARSTDSIGVSLVGPMPSFGHKLCQPFEMGIFIGVAYRLDESSISPSSVLSAAGHLIERTVTGLSCATVTGSYLFNHNGASTSLPNSVEGYFLMGNLLFRNIKHARKRAIILNERTV